MAAQLPEGFAYLERKSGDVEVDRVNKLGAVLRGSQAERCRARASRATELERQHLMARVTGNEKRGNERKG